MANQDLAKIEGDEIVVRVPISSLDGAASQGLEAVGIEYGDDEGMDWDQLASDIVHTLNSESEDGTTLVHEMLDKAVMDASENGAEAFAYLDEN